jgi:hypothetical protein
MGSARPPFPGFYKASELFSPLFSGFYVPNVRRSQFVKASRVGDILLDNAFGTVRAATTIYGYSRPLKYYM